MTNLDMQNLNRETMKHLKNNIIVGMSLLEVRNICEKGGADEILDQIQSLTGGGYAHVFLRR